MWLLWCAAGVPLQAPADMGEDVVRGTLGPEHKETVEETYDIYLLPPGEDKETCVSYLRMRNRDGRYSLMFEVRSHCLTARPCSCCQGCG